MRVYSINPKNYASRMVAFCKRAGVTLNIDHPTTIQDKLAWLNINDENAAKVDCADKLKVKSYSFWNCDFKDVNELCPKTIASSFTPEDIDWKKLPANCIIKCNHGCGMNIRVSAFTPEVIAKIIPTLNRWMSIDYAFASGFEAHYHDIPHMVFAEELIGDGKQALIDYKFLCFNGEPKFMQVITGRNTKQMRMNYYDMNMQPCKGLSRTDIRADYTKQDVLPTKFELMKEYARNLADPFRFVRVDFYEVDGRVYLGEMTFTPAACGFRYVNPKDEIMMGSYLHL